ncbi:hypothetical protein [Synergistes jonesii]|uniref:Uncharacterized protein n=1 Tax=Synergistes jonesii TaxID=2754 RepID=A0A073J6L0_9BACT|nr:hypothetical protein [Synergistes jonesii]KEJ93362.1 hypothetical protein EH55_08660 [Synergistes jonesii]MDY2983830.1 hypothetical protein [Synergistes jonesii]OFB65116.1 hypothetical protein JS73_01165 [Synergistes jonesii]OFB65937.1 hypothetical protein JS72_00325 [Synergistes jonesii]OFB66389.1 hypothetical protein JS79_01175 [Synergistes jonesii]
MNYVKEYEELMRKNIPDGVSMPEESVMQRADRRYKRLVERGIIRREEPFIATSTTVSDVTFNR